MEFKRILYAALATAGILLIPLLAMQLTDQVNWTAFDFAVAGGLLLGAGLLGDLAWRKIGRRGYRIAAVIAVAAALLLVWAELAVGVFGTPLAGN